MAHPFLEGGDTATCAVLRALPLLLSSSDGVLLHEHVLVALLALGHAQRAPTVGRPAAVTALGGGNPGEEWGGGGGGGEREGGGREGGVC